MSTTEAGTPASHAAAFWFLAVLPLLAVLFNRGHMGIAAIGLAIATVAAMRVTGVRGALGQIVRAWRPPYGPTVLAVLVFCILAEISSFWAFDPPLALARAASLAGVVLIALPLPALLSHSDARTTTIFAFSGLLAASLFLAEETIGPAVFSSWRIAVHYSQWPMGTEGNERLLDHYLMQINRSVVTVSLLLWPTGFLLWHRGRKDLLALLLLVALPAIAASFSQSAILGAIVGAVAALVTVLAWRLAVYGFAAAVMLLAAETPMIFKIMPDRAGEFLVKAAGGGGAAERLVIWKAFAESVFQRPILGWGADAGRFFGADDVPPKFVPKGWPDQMWHHPHNGFLQAWVDMGVFGGLTLGAIFAAASFAIAGLPASLRPAAMGCLAASAAVTLVSHGLWQTWSLMLMALCAAFFVWLGKTVALEADLSAALNMDGRPYA
ncbi:MAG: O-antigen ligase family protein [Flavobacteriaceae bacterium]